tara:strand:+ start:64 stop:1029 length:966 start_codon:yes stop_codon:yes gene_type:complete
MENKILVTGCAGFIGYHLTKIFCKKGYNVFGIDDLNKYYDINLKNDRLSRLKKNKNFTFKKIDIADPNLIEFFKDNHFTNVIHLAAQVGVRNSKINPFKYIKSNISGFVNILECCKVYNIKSIFYASSSSVYGNHKSELFKENDLSNKPISLYGATKLSNELIAYAYKDLYNINSIGLRFFTVYGPWGRPDMAYYSFTKSILNDDEIKVFNNGDHKRAFTYIDDVTRSVHLLFEKFKYENDFYEVLNIGGSDGLYLNDFIDKLENLLGKRAIKKNISKQPGDVYSTNSDCSRLKELVAYKPKISLDVGLKKFVSWFKEYHK